MAERPILFQGAMVRALLADAKTHTRRAIKLGDIPQTASFAGWQQHGDRAAAMFSWPAREVMGRAVVTGFGGLCCPYGQPGDRLWVRESWMPDPPNDGSWAYTAWSGERIGQIASVPERFQHPAFCNYAASWLHGRVRWTPGIHMPRWACRILLEITDVRVERLQEISEADALAEGLERLTGVSEAGGPLAAAPVLPARWEPPRDAYRRLWESINGAGSWDANPWVWVVSFRKVQPC